MRPPRRRVGDLLHRARHAGVVLVDEAQHRHVVLDMRVEAGREEHHLGTELVAAPAPRCRRPTSRKPCEPVPAGSGTLTMLRAGDLGAAVGIERVLERAHHQHALVVLEDVLGAVAVVHVEVDDRDALEAVRFERVRRGDGDVVEEAEAHGAIARWRGGPADARCRTRSPRRRSITRSTAITAAPAARSAALRRAGLIAVSGSRCTRPCSGAAAKTSRRIRPDGRAPAVRAGERRLVALEVLPDARGDQLVVDGRRAAPGIPGGTHPCRASCNRHG